MLCDLPSWLTGRATDRNVLQKDKNSNLRCLRIDAFKLVLGLVYSGEASSIVAMSQEIQNHSSLRLAVCIFLAVHNRNEGQGKIGQYSPIVLTASRWYEARRKPPTMASPSRCVATAPPVTQNESNESNHRASDERAIPINRQ